MWKRLLNPKFFWGASKRFTVLLYFNAILFKVLLYFVLHKTLTWTRIVTLLLNAVFLKTLLWFFSQKTHKSNFNFLLLPRKSKALIEANFKSCTFDWEYEKISQIPRDLLNNLAEIISKDFKFTSQYFKASL